MRAVVVDRWQEPKDLAVREVAEPVPRAGQVVVDVRAAGCNFFDILLVQGKYQMKPSFPFTPGAEVAGTVSALGPAWTCVHEVSTAAAGAPSTSASAARIGSDVSRVIASKSQVTNAARASPSSTTRMRSSRSSRTSVAGSRRSP